MSSLSPSLTPTNTPIRLPQLVSLKPHMDPVVYNRALHCVTEDIRTLSAVDALKENDFTALGEHMTQSHRSLQLHYEVLLYTFPLSIVSLLPQVSCEELDSLVDLALAVPGVLGSRMTGGGFGGCTITLVERGAAQNLISHLKSNYFLKYQTECVCYECLPSAGAGLISDTRGFLSSKIHCQQSSPAAVTDSGNEDFVPLVLTLAVAAIGFGFYFVTKRK
jgi:hypothetical protein